MTTGTSGSSSARWKRYAKRATWWLGSQLPATVQTFVQHWNVRGRWAPLRWPLRVKEEAAWRRLRQPCCALLRRTPPESRKATFSAATCSVNGLNYTTEKAELEKWKRWSASRAGHVRKVSANGTSLRFGGLPPSTGSSFL